jgi:ribosomal protein S27E
MHNRKIYFDLFTNGLDFILASIDAVTKVEEDNTQIKYAILNLSAGVDLVLKERLSIEHWSLLFENINNASKADINTGDFLSVNSNTCLKRLQNVCSIDFSQKDLSILNNLRKQRNKMEHFAVSENIEALKSILSKVLSLIIDFVEKEFEDTQFTEEQNQYYNEIRIRSSDFEKFVDLRLAQLKSELKAQPWLCKCEHCLQKTVTFDSESQGLKCLFCKQTDSSKVIVCPECLNNSLTLDGWNSIVHCLSCKYTDDPEKIATNYYEKVDGHSFHLAYLDGDDSVKTLCFDCGSDSLIKVKNEYLCLDCQNSWNEENVRGCDNCGELYFRNSEDDHFRNCDNCIEYRMSKYD